MLQQQRLASPVRVLLVTHCFPPDPAAPAHRAEGLVKNWARVSREVSVLASTPCWPDGEIAEGYKNRFSVETRDGVAVYRAPVLSRPNRGVLNRILLYVSFMLSAIVYSFRMRKSPHVVIATSPHLFVGIAGYVIARLKRARFVFEVRDIWPESVVDSDVLKHRSVVVEAAKRVVRWLYRAADRVVAVSPGFLPHLEENGVRTAAITVVPNGAELEACSVVLDSDAPWQLRQELGLEGDFVVGYVGTIGSAHGLEIILEAAALSERPQLKFLIAGSGAQSEQLRKTIAEENISNVVMLGKCSRRRALQLQAMCDVLLIHLKRRPVFQTVLPSKMFDAMGLGKPIILGVAGESARLVTRLSSGICVEPENPRALLKAAKRLMDDRTLTAAMSNAGRKAVGQEFHRCRLAAEYWQSMEALLKGSRTSEEQSLVLSRTQPAVQGKEHAFSHSKEDGD